MEPILERLSTQDKDKLLTASNKMHIPKNSIIFKGGTVAEHVYFIHKGKVRIFNQIGPDKDLTIFTRGVNDGFGEIGIFGAQNYSNSAIAVQDSDLYAIKRDIIEDV